MKQKTTPKKPKRPSPLSRFALWLVILAGLVLLARPIVTDWINA